MDEETHIEIETIKNRISELASDIRYLQDLADRHADDLRAIENQLRK